MTSPEDVAVRLDAYRNEVALHYNKTKISPRVDYVLANLALEELKFATERAEPPSELAFTRVEDRFREAARTSRGPLLNYRSQLIGAWVRPIVWSDIINLNPLTGGEARHVAKNIHLGEAADHTADIARDALKQFDRHSSSNPRVKNELIGFLGEVTSVLLPARHTTAKQYVVPTTQFDDEMHPAAGLHADAIYFDNRRQRTHKKSPFQVESSSGHHSHIAIPIVNARTLGILSKSSRWPHDDRSFVTLRHLIDERIGDGIDQDTSSRLDRINSALTAIVFQSNIKIDQPAD